MPITTLIKLEMYTKNCFNTEKNSVNYPYVSISKMFVLCEFVMADLEIQWKFSFQFVEYKHCLQKHLLCLIFQTVDHSLITEKGV